MRVGCPRLGNTQGGGKISGPQREELLRLAGNKAKLCDKRGFI